MILVISLGEKLEYPTRNFERPKEFSKNPTGIMIFPIGEKYFLQEFNSDR